MRIVIKYSLMSMMKSFATTNTQDKTNQNNSQYKHFDNFHNKFIRHMNSHKCIVN